MLNNFFVSNVFAYEDKFTLWLFNIQISFTLKVKNNKVQH